MLLAAVAWPWAPHVLAATELRAITSDDSPATRRVVEALKSRFSGLVVGSDPQALAWRGGPAIYFAVGPAALQAATALDLEAPVVALFTSSQTFHTILAGLPATQARRRVTAIYAEASPEHQLRLIAAIFQRHVSVGVLLTPGTARLEPLLAQAARDVGVEIRAHHTARGANMVRELNRLGATDVLLAVPDANVFTPDSVRNILESTYRRGQPVVGFSQGMVAAGALASAYSSVEDIVAQAEQLVAELQAARTPDPQYPAFWRVAVNDTVARSLNILIPQDVRELGDQPALRKRQ